VFFFFLEKNNVDISIIVTCSILTNGKIRHGGMDVRIWNKIKHMPKGL